jgi:hypothetical protein
LPGGFRKWTFETNPAFAMCYSFSVDRYPVWAHTNEPVLLRSSSPVSSRPSYRAASVTDLVRMNR